MASVATQPPVAVGGQLPVAAPTAVPATAGAVPGGVTSGDLPSIFRTADLSPLEAEALYHRILDGVWSKEDAELFRAQMLTEMAKMSLDDGLVMQIHPGSFRNHNRWLHGAYGRDKGADIPQGTDYVRALKPLLDRFGRGLSART